VRFPAKAEAVGHTGLYLVCWVCWRIHGMPRRWRPGYPYGFGIPGDPKVFGHFPFTPSRFYYYQRGIQSLANSAQPKTHCGAGTPLDHVIQILPPEDSFTPGLESMLQASGLYGQASVSRVLPGCLIWIRSRNLRLAHANGVNNNLRLDRLDCWLGVVSRERGWKPKLPPGVRQFC